MKKQYAIAVALLLVSVVVVTVIMLVSRSKNVVVPKRTEVVKVYTPYLEICDNGVDDDCDGETDEGCDGPGRFEHCWTLPSVASQVAFEGCVGWSTLMGPGDGRNGRLICTGPWQVLAETRNVKSFCFAVALEPGMFIEYNSVSNGPVNWGCSGPLPPGVNYGAHVVTQGGAQVSPALVDNRFAGCNFRFLSG